MSDQGRNLRSVNLNLLPILEALLECKNVTRAAAKVNLTQSAVSASLKRLREMFHDDLLVMQGREMVLTEKAEMLIPVVRQALDAVSQIVNEQEFDAATTARRFSILTADYISAIIVAQLGGIIETQAPGISLSISQGKGETTREIQMGFFDLLIAPQSLQELSAFQLDNPNSDFQYQICLRDHLVAIESADNTGDSSNLSLEEYLARPHATFQLHPDHPSSIENDTLTKLGLSQNEKFIVPYFTLLPQFVCSMKDAVAVVPASLAHHYARFFPIRWFKPPIEFPEHNLVMIWARTRDREPDLCWLRNALMECASSVSVNLQTDASP